MLKKSTISTLTVLLLLQCSSIVHAGRASDLANGIVPEDKKEVPFSQWHAQVIDEVEQNIQDYSRTLSQLEAYFAPDLRSPDLETREITLRKAQAICSFLEKKIEKNYNKKILIEGQGENARDTSVTRSSMKDFTQYGVHATLRREGKQQEADAYALLRYFTYKNMYDAIPNPDNEVQEEKLISVVHPGQKALILKIVQQTASDLIPIIESAVRDKIEQAAFERGVVEFHKTLKPYRLVPLTLLTTYPHYSREEIRAGAIDSQALSIIYSKTKTQFSLQPPRIDTIYEDPDDRPHVFLKNQADKWFQKINLDSPFIKELGLDAAFLNKNLNKDISSLSGSPREALSFVFQEEFKAPSPLEEKADAQSSVEGRSLHVPIAEENEEKINGRTAKAQRMAELIDQLSLKFGCIAIKRENPQFIKCLKSILNFLETKHQKYQEQMKATGTGYREVEQYNPMAAASHAFVKYISYTQLHYALTYNATENQTTSLASSSNIRNSQLGMSGMFINSFVSLTHSIDEVFQAKALKWGQRVYESKSSFLDDNALKASLF